MEEEQPIKILTATVTGDHFIEALKSSNMHSFLRYIPTRDAIRWFIISLAVLLLVWVTANQMAWWAWVFIPVLLVFIVLTGVMIVEIAMLIKLQHDIKTHAKFLGNGKPFEFKIYETYFHFKLGEEVYIEKWKDLHGITIGVSTITMTGATKGDFYFLEPSFSREDFEYLRKLFQEKIV